MALIEYFIENEQSNLSRVEDVETKADIQTHACIAGWYDRSFDSAPSNTRAQRGVSQFHAFDYFVHSSTIFLERVTRWLHDFRNYTGWGKSN